ncbi:MAG: hypothetical protein AAF614_17555 [Chloroflexota bacterium]
MRLLEVLLLAVNIPVLLWPLLGSERPFWLSWLSLTAVLFLVFHLLLEGYRWQMVPAYLLTGWFAILAVNNLVRGSVVPSYWLTVVIAIFGLIAFVIAFALPILLPVPKLLPPTGPVCHWHC